MTYCKVCESCSTKESESGICQKWGYKGIGSWRLKIEKKLGEKKAKPVFY